MIKNSFLQVKGISENIEKDIWDKGIYCLESYMKVGKSNNYKKNINISLEALNQKNSLYFYRNLSSKEHWRMYKDFMDSACFIDIEATGFYKHDNITTISLYDGNNIKWYINGKNLEQFKEDIKKYKLIITFHGGAFDIPFIEKNLNIPMNYPHIDLFILLKSLGYKKSLKKTYKEFGFACNPNLESIDGNIAIILWDKYKKTDDIKYLEALLCYNIEDVIMLENLMIESYNKKITQLPIKLDKIEIKKRFENPFTPSPEIIKEVKDINSKINPKK